MLSWEIAVSEYMHFYDCIIKCFFQKDCTNLQPFKQGFTAHSPLLRIIIFFHTHFAYLREKNDLSLLV